MLKQLFFALMVSICLFQVKAWADDYAASENNLEKICSELNNGETDIKKHIGENISFNYFTWSYNKLNDGSAEFSKDLFIGPDYPKHWLNCKKIVIEHPSISSLVAPADRCTITGVIKDIDVAKITITIDHADVCYTQSNLR